MHKFNAYTKTFRFINSIFMPFIRLLFQVVVGIEQQQYASG